MFMSIFSSFDAVCAESFGQKVGIAFPLHLPLNREDHPPPPPPPKAVVNLSSSSGSLIMKKEENNNNNYNKTTSSSLPSQKNQQGERKARFAPEFDGLHCFETIVPCY